MANEKEKNVHEGHRARLVDVAFKAGLENLSNIQVMELLLFYIFPRGDTNPLAHRLLDKFGTLADVVDADINDLLTVKGIGERAAKMIKLKGELYHYYTNCRLSGKIILKTLSNIYDYCETLLRLSKVEELYIVGLNASFGLLGKRCLATGSISMVGIERYEVTSFLNSFRPAYVFVTHNHPGGSAIPSQQDFAATDNLKNLLHELGVNLIDHIIVGNDGIYSIERKSMQREYRPID